MKKNVVIVILVILVLGMGGYLVYNKAIDKDVKEESNTNKTEIKLTNKEYTYKELAGNYYFETNANFDEIPELKVMFRLVLDENGTFNYQHASQIPEGFLGNYIIDGNKIILNYTFGTGSDSALYYNVGTTTLTIDEEANLTAVVGDEANGHYLERIKGTEIVLKKQTDTSNYTSLPSFNEAIKEYAGNDKIINDGLCDNLNQN